MPTDSEPPTPHEQALLDEALDDTFPASDPVSMTQPRGHEEEVAET